MKPCETCHGDAYGTDMEPCPACHGEGFIDDGSPATIDNVDNPFGAPTLEQEAVLAKVDWKDELDT